MKKTHFSLDATLAFGISTLCLLTTACGGGGSTADNSAAAAATPVTTVTPVTPVATPPSSPTDVVATLDSTSVSLAFSAPAESGSASITGYTGVCIGNGSRLTGTAASSPVTVSALLAGVSYSCTVMATSTAGSSAASATVTAALPAALTVATTLNLNLNALDNYAAPALPTYYDAAVAAADNTPANDPVTNRVATVGRVLFHDKRLSVNDAVACASCHQQSHAFDDVNRFSTGFSGTAFTSAHAMRLGNIRYYRPGTMFWDQRASSIENQATQPIQNSIEMGFDAAHGSLAALVSKMQTLPYYTELFNFAFGDAGISESRIQRALAQFQRSMVSVNSRWDTGYASTFNAALPDKGLGLPVPGFSATEERGRVLYFAPPGQGGAGCVACHVAPTFALAANSRSNGLDAGETRLFKAPSLKSVGLSSAFMHDGRFSTLEQVIEHYDSGVQAGPALDNRLAGPNGGPPRRLNLSAADKAALAAFLRTLNDPVLAEDPKYTNPFKR